MVERTLQEHQAPIAADPKEKRRHPRYPFSATAEIIDIQAKTRITGRTSDIARMGCYIDTISPLAANAAVALRITQGKESFETRATVAYSLVGMGMGLLFTTTEPAQIRILEAWLRELRGEKLDDAELAGAALQFDDTKADVHDPRGILSELILLLSRKGVLSEPEGNAMLQKLFK
jgi:hypothetical protein